MRRSSESSVMMSDGYLREFGETGPKYPKSLTMSTSAPILSDVYGGRPRDRFSNLPFEVTLTFKLTARF